jgi:hypothetical protein
MDGHAADHSIGSGDLPTLLYPGVLGRVTTTARARVSDRPLLHPRKNVAHAGNGFTSARSDSAHYRSRHAGLITITGDEGAFLRRHARDHTGTLIPPVREMEVVGLL